MSSSNNSAKLNLIEIEEQTINSEISVATYSMWSVPLLSCGRKIFWEFKLIFKMTEVIILK